MTLTANGRTAIRREVDPANGGQSAAPRLGRVPALDGLRGLAFAGVFIGHVGPWAGIAALSMYVFFALSGFLITSLLLEEHATTGTIRLRHFFARRALRLLPGLGLFLACWFAVDLALGAHLWFTTVPGGGAGSPERPLVALQGVAGAAGYLTNWLTIDHAFTGYVPLGHLWSLSVEEQLYLVWAPVLLFALRASKRLAVAIALVAAVASFADVAILLASHRSLWAYMGTDTRAGAFLLGGCLALVRLRIRRLPRRVADLLAAASLVVLWKQAWPLAHYSGQVRTVGAWLLGTFASVALVASITAADGVFARLLSGRVLGYLGRRSYALYLWSYVWLTWLRDLGNVGSAIALLATLACAEGSWHLVEAPCLRRKKRFAAETAPVSVRQEPVLEPQLASQVA